MDDKKLKLIKTPAPLKDLNNFWRTCPRLLKFLPEKPCEQGKPSISTKSKRVQDEPKCPWWINSKEYKYCFWKYVHDKSSSDGVMPELVQSELAQLFGWSNTKTHFVLKEAIEELTNALSVYGAMDLLREIDNDDLEDIVSVEDGYVSEDTNDPYK